MINKYCIKYSDAVDECLSSPCQNGGTCMDDISSYQCACADLFTGADCETGKLCYLTPEPDCETGKLCYLTPEPDCETGNFVTCTPEPGVDCKIGKTTCWISNLWFADLEHTGLFRERYDPCYSFGGRTI